MNHILAHATDNDETVTDGTVLTCEHCGDEATIIGHKAAVVETWNQEHSYCAVLPATKAIEKLNDELDPGDVAATFLNTNRPHWSDPEHDIRANDPAFSQWNSEWVVVYDPREGGGPIPGRIKFRLSQLTTHSAPIINVRRLDFNEDGKAETLPIIKAAVPEARKLAAAFTFLADLAEGQVTV